MAQIFTSPLCLGHRAPTGYPECPQRLENVLSGLREQAFEITEVSDHPQARKCVEATHDPEYVARFERAIERGDGLLDSADNPLSAGTWDAAWGAVKTTLQAAEFVVGAKGREAFSAVRPPGHHAERSLAMGFCFLNNAAVAAEYLRLCHGLERVAIFDFDVHHGNGTQHIFEDRGDVFYASTHQAPFYPGTGEASEQGIGKGKGATLNVPLPVGTGDREFLEAVDEQILPAILHFQPQILIASAGFDVWQGDPLGGFKVTMDGITALGQRLRDSALENCEGRLLSVLEGGYDLRSLSGLVTSYLGKGRSEGPGESL